MQNEGLDHNDEQLCGLFEYDFPNILQIIDFPLSESQKSSIRLRDIQGIPNQLHKWPP